MTANSHKETGTTSERAPSALRRTADDLRGVFHSGPDLRRLYLAIATDSIGLGVYLAFSALYLGLAVKLPPAQVGIALSVAGVASLVGLLPLGAVADRMGAARALTVFFVYRALSFAALLLAWDFVSAVVAVALAGLVSRATGPVTQALVLQLTPSEKDRVNAMAALRSLRNAGFALGAAPAALAAAVGTPTAYRSVLGITVVAFFATALIVRGLPNVPVPRKERVKARAVARDRWFMVLTVLHGAFSLHAFVLGIGMPLWLARETGAPEWVSPLLLVVNTVMVVLFQIPFSRGTEDPATARARLALAGLVLTAVCALIPFSALLPPIAAVAVLLALLIALSGAELWHTAGTWGLAQSRIPDNGAGIYLAFFNFGFAAATVAGPAAIGLVLEAGTWGWAALAVWFLLLAGATLLLPLRPQSRPDPT
ncbi:MFS transporter [Haloglycomyces albus]|uniref:MFS transporter n=1 Tax=Haloglycomyces albus TaxID=526067 RepID=UPI00046C9AC5|nr:MFS transporter [Haloglycomyces albus]